MVGGKMSRGGGPKKYRQVSVLDACRKWYETHDDVFTSKDLYESGLITFRQKTQHINAKSVSIILGILMRRGNLELVEDGRKKKQTTYRYKA